jgi:hypothetical protein
MRTTESAGKGKKEADVLQQRLQVMISSRNTGSVGSSKLSMEALRARLRKELAGELFGRSPIFEVYLNEYEPAPGAEATIRERCCQKVREADIVLILYDGRAGWSAHDTIGICHIEMAEALGVSRRKTRFLELPLAPDASSAAEQRRDQAYRNFYEREQPWAAVNLNDADEIVTACQAAVASAVIELAHADAVATLRGARGDSGDALDWTRMNYTARASAMIDSAQRAFLQAGAAQPAEPRAPLHLPKERFLTRQIAGMSVLLCFHAIPAAMTVAAAREMVGQPFLQDHLVVPLLADDIVGPIHLIACARGVSEAQAIRQLGFPDATIVVSGFGVYVADEVQKVQFAFLDNCRDETSSFGKVEELLDWLTRTQEDARLARRARSRARIVKAVAQELEA